MPVPLAITLAPLIAQAGLGTAQYFGGRKKARENDFTEYDIPQSMKDALANIQRQQGNKYMPGEQITRQLENENLAGAISQLTGSLGSAGDIGQAVTSIEGQRMRNENQRGAQRAGYLDSLEEKERQLLLKQTEFEDQKYKINELLPYQQQAQAASALMGSGIQNAFGALTSMAGLGMEGAFDKSGEVGTRDVEMMETIEPKTVSDVAIGNANIGAPSTIKSPYEPVMSIEEILKLIAPNGTVNTNW